MLAINDEDTDLAKDMKDQIKCDLLQRCSEPETDKLLSIVYVLFCRSMIQGGYLKMQSSLLLQL